MCTINRWCVILNCIPLSCHFRWSRSDVKSGQISQCPRLNFHNTGDTSMNLTHMCTTIGGMSHITLSRSLLHVQLFLSLTMAMSSYSHKQYSVEKCCATPCKNYVRLCLYGHPVWLFMSPCCSQFLWKFGNHNDHEPLQVWLFFSEGLLVHFYGHNFSIFLHKRLASILMLLVSGYRLWITILVCMLLKHWLLYVCYWNIDES